jgi:hypothetical protein
METASLVYTVFLQKGEDRKVVATVQYKHFISNISWLQIDTEKKKRSSKFDTSDKRIKLDVG